MPKKKVVDNNKYPSKIVVHNNFEDVPLQKVIKKNRHRLKMSQEQLAQAVGCKRSTIACYETGYITPSLEMAHKLADFFGISLDELTRDESLCTAEEEPLEPVPASPRRRRGERPAPAPGPGGRA